MACTPEDITKIRSRPELRSSVISTASVQGRLPLDSLTRALCLAHARLLGWRSTALRQPASQLVAATRFVISRWLVLNVLSDFARGELVALGGAPKNRRRGLANCHRAALRPIRSRDSITAGGLQEHPVQIRRDAHCSKATPPLMSNRVSLARLRGRLLFTFRLTLISISGNGSSTDLTR